VIDYPAPRRRLPRQNLWLAEVRHKGGLAKAGAHIRNRTSFSFPIAKAISRNGGLGSRRLKHSAEGASLLLSGPKVWRLHYHYCAAGGWSACIRSSAEPK
jgi:hypothetical protein